MLCSISAFSCDPNVMTFSKASLYFMEGGRFPNLCFVATSKERTYNIFLVTIPYIRVAYAVLCQAYLLFRDALRSFFLLKLYMHKLFSFSSYECKKHTHKKK